MNKQGNQRFEQKSRTRGNDGRHAPSLQAKALRILHRRQQLGAQPVLAGILGQQQAVEARVAGGQVVCGQAGDAAGSSGLLEVAGQGAAAASHHNLAGRHMQRSQPESGPALWISSGSLPSPPTGALQHASGAEEAEQASATQPKPPPPPT